LIEKSMNYPHVELIWYYNVYFKFHPMYVDLFWPVTTHNHMNGIVSEMLHIT